MNESIVGIGNNLSSLYPLPFTLFITPCAIRRAPNAVSHTLSPSTFNLLPYTLFLLPSSLKSLP